MLRLLRLKLPFNAPLVLTGSRTLATSGRHESLFQNFKEAMKKESEKEGLDAEIEKLKKDIAKDAKNFEESEKFKKLKKETASGAESVKHKIDDLEQTIKDSKYGEQIKGAAKTVESFGGKIGDIIESVKNIEHTTVQTAEERMKVFTDDYVSPNYTPPSVIRKRKQIDENMRQINYDADTETQGMAVHKDWLIYEKFKNSSMGKRMDDVTTRISSSENTLLRGMVILNDKVATKSKKIFSNQYNETIKSIKRMDKNFDQEIFVKFLEKELVPIILEAKAMNDTEVIEDWCHDSPAQKFSIKHREADKNKMNYFEKTINLQKLELADAKIHEGVPTFQINFETNTLMAYTDKQGNILEATGYPKPDEVYKTYNLWTICRDPMEPEPAAAWRVLECEDFSSKLAF